MNEKLINKLLFFKSLKPAKSKLDQVLEPKGTFELETFKVFATLYGFTLVVIFWKRENRNAPC
ncbi:MAG: hypothetical protein DRR19_25285 [Candidatus Parabeggiatoa sp. nov. 1]|nr:MAG: hypothetical protein DRR19_25285 [Gammaproteobacteria bacterium]